MFQATLSYTQHSAPTNPAITTPYDLNEMLSPGHRAYLSRSHAVAPWLVTYVMVIQHSIVLYY